jgi:tetratricopeptide (TPR) repeat protein
MRICRSILILIASGLMAWATVQAGDAPEDLQTTFAKAIALMQVENFVDALPLLRDVANKAPDRPNVFWNLGIAAAAAGDKQLALKAWLQYHTLEPNDLKGVVKLIQSYQALDMPKERDRERDNLLTARAALPPADREKMPMYARDQFDVIGTHMIVFEFFEPHGSIRTIYKFQALDASHKPLYYYALESDDSTSTVAAELGQIGKNDRIYSLDKYDGPAHSTYQLLNALPTYDAVRASVISAAEGKLHPVSSSTSATKK